MAQPYPPFEQSNGKLLTKIREVRTEAVKKIQQLAIHEFEKKSTRFRSQAEGEALISTIEAMSKGKHTPVIDEKLSHTVSFVGKAKAA